jgi:DNA-binding NarL/FixJ family response regulator
MNSPITIILFEDDGHFATNLSNSLQFLSDTSAFQQRIKIERKFYFFEDSCLEYLIDNQPNLILLDIEPPLNSPYDGITACEKIRNTPELQNTKILILSAHIDEIKVFTAIINGADGYICKSDLGTIVQDIHKVHCGDNVLSKSIQNQLFRTIRNLKNPERIEGFEATLTEKQRKIWDEKLKGTRYKDIADKMHITIDTVKFHIGNINPKLKDFKAENPNFLDKIKAFLQSKRR